MVLTRSMATTNNAQEDDPPRSTALERQVQTLMTAVKRLTKRNHDLEKQPRSGGAATTKGCRTQPSGAKPGR